MESQTQRTEDATTPAAAGVTGPAPKTQDATGTSRPPGSDPGQHAQAPRRQDHQREHPPHRGGRGEGRQPGRSERPRRPDRPGRADRPGHTERPGRARRGPWPGFTPEQLAARAAAVPALTYPAELPVSARREDIAAAVRDHQVVIVAGETGSGKTTQIPKICLELGRGVTGMIGHTQPRRIAARSVAERIAHELGTPIGREGVVGYQVRFTDEVGPATLVKLMTDGILLAEIQTDPMLRRYDTVIVDEAHERSLNIDFILGYLARLLPSRPDLKVIITSATIDSARFAEHFGHRGVGGDGEPLTVPAPVIEVSGRTYPVEIRYRPLTPETGDDGAPTDGAPPQGAEGSREEAGGAGAAPTSATPTGTGSTGTAPGSPVPGPPAAPGELTDAELEALTSPDPAVRSAARARRQAARSAPTPRGGGARGRGQAGAGSQAGAGGQARAGGPAIVRGGGAPGVRGARGGWAPR